MRDPVVCMQKEVFKDLNNFGLCARSKVTLGKWVEPFRSFLCPL